MRCIYAGLTTVPKAGSSNAARLKRVVHLFIQLPQCINFGRAKETVDRYSDNKLQPGKPGYNEKELDLAKKVLSNW